MQATGVSLRFDVATHDDLDAIRRINHRTFAEEIPQHVPRADGRLVDRHENDSLFIVARAAEGVVGMLALRATRPFSLDGKVANLDRFLPPGRRPCEVRLLAVEPSRRQGIVLRGLLARLVHECDARGLDLAVLSATTRQLPLYAHLGCVPFADPVGSTDAWFQPMYITREALLERVGQTIGHSPVRVAAPACFMTGPVPLLPAVQRRLRAPLTSHRGDAFAADLAQVRAGLRALTGARHVALCAGSGTLANDLIAVQLAALKSPGVIVANGEFGDRLVDHAARHALAHVVVRRPWGSAVDAEAIDFAVRRAGAGWIWAVHCETSTGMLNDLDTLRAIAVRRGVRLAIDAASSVGAVPVDLAGVAFASTVSGKALGAVAGLAIVCCDERPEPQTAGVARYLDLARYIDGDGVPYTQSSLLLGALATAVAATDWPQRFADIRRANAILLDRMLLTGHRPLVSRTYASPAVATWLVPEGTDQASVGAALERRGFALSWHSGYLRERGWIQTAFMGDFVQEAVLPLAKALGEALGLPFPHRAPSPFRGPSTAPRTGTENLPGTGTQHRS